MPIPDTNDTIANRQGRIRSMLAGLTVVNAAEPQTWPSEANARQESGALLNPATVRTNLITLMGTQTIANIANVEDWLDRGTGATQYSVTP